MRIKTTGYCPTRKLRYATGYQAQLALDSAKEMRRRKGNTEHVECRIYNCSCCDGWHLTSQPPKTCPSDTPPRKPLILTYKEA